MMKRKFPRISIITPSYNQGKFIRQTIDSVLSQGYPNLEYIVIDGGSTDNTLEILKSYGKKIKWISEKDKGQANAINKGLKQSSGEIVAFINSDDYYLSGVLKNVGQYFRKNKDCGVVTGDYVIVNELGIKYQTFVSFYKSVFRKFHCLGLLSVVNYINQPSTFWRMDVCHDIGLFDEKLVYTMDYDFWMRVEKAKIKIGYLDKKLSAFRIHSNSKGGSRFTQQFAEEQEVQKKHNDKVALNILHAFHSYLIIGLYKIIK